MGDFEAAYVAWRNQAFPPGSADSSLDELHADLALADTWVAESVIPYIERGVYEPAQIDVIDELHSFCNRVDDLKRRGGGGDPILSDTYRDYAELLIRVYESFLEQAPRGQ